MAKKKLTNEAINRHKSQFWSLTNRRELCPEIPPSLILIMFLDLLTTIVGGRVLLTDIVTIFCIQRVSLTNSASKPSYRFAIKKAQNASHLFSLFA